jgi:ribonucleoside-triphosphate reductase (formate)
MFKKIIKRDGNESVFDKNKIKSAIFKAGRATGEFGQEESDEFTSQVIENLENALNKKELRHAEFPHVEEVQNAVERVLMKSRYKQTAKAYILYREQHTEM